MEYILKSKYETIDDINEYLENVEGISEISPYIIYLYKNDNDMYIIKTQNNIQCYGEKIFPNESIVAINIPKSKDFQNSDHLFLLEFIENLKNDLEKKIKNKDIEIKTPFDKEAYNFKTMNCKFVKNYTSGQGIYYYWKIYDKSYNKEPLLLEYDEWSQLIKQQKRYNVVH